VVATILFVLDFLSLVSYSVMRHFPVLSPRDRARPSLTGSGAQEGVILVALAIAYVFLGTSSTFSHHIDRLLILTAILLLVTYAVYAGYRNR
jgi:hypothetical protein